MKQILLVICWLFPAALFAQIKVEKPFQYFENWENVLNEAKAKNKNIFIDAYTTWCPPCKKMDKEVYSDINVIANIDSSFIAIKVQMDQTKSDLPEVREWYSAAEMLSKRFKIESFPTFIFLDPNGNLIQINKGFQPVNTFLNTLKDANDPKNAITTQLANYRSGKTHSKELLKLALQTKEYKMDSLALEIARAYKQDYLDKQELHDIVNPDLIPLLVNFDKIMSLNDRIIKYCYRHPYLVDSLLQRKGVAQSILDFYIDRHMIYPILENYLKSQQSSGPDWGMIHNKVTKKYDKKTAERIVVNQQIGYYRRIKDWEKQAKYEIDKIEKFGLDTAGMGKTTINNLAYDLFFRYVSDPAYLKKAISYMETILEIDPKRDAWIDTYANLLYKAGDKGKAIKCQEKALNIATEMNYKDRIQEYSQNLKKMRADQPTWITNIND